MMKSARLSFTGDIMCPGELLAACAAKDGYDFAPLFAPAKRLFSGSDYVVGNLETPIAGEAFGYTSERYCFNNPPELAAAVRAAGFDLVSTANNHCMDRDTAGLFATLDNLDRAGLAHIGTSRTPEERERRFLRKIRGIRVGFLAYTYGTNAFAHHRFLPPEQSFAVNLFQPEEGKPGSIHLLDPMERIAERVEELYHEGNPVYGETVKPFLAQFRSDARKLREDGADFVVLLMHSGGQYNLEPDPYTRKLTELITADGDVDLVIGHHPHILHPCGSVNGRPVAFSLGNFLATPQSLPPEAPDYARYSAVLHLHLEKEAERTSLRRMTFSLAVSEMGADGKTAAHPLFERIANAADPGTRAVLLRDNRQMVHLLRGDNPGREVPPAPEYDLPLNRA